MWRLVIYAINVEIFERRKYISKHFINSIINYVIQKQNTYAYP